MDTGKHYSYNTLLTDYFMGELFCNQTYYSVTTRRHQARLPEVDFNHRLHNCPYGNFNIYDAFKFEIMDIQAELTRRTTKRKIFKNSSELAKLHQKLVYLQGLVTYYETMLIKAYNNMNNNIN